MNAAPNSLPATLDGCDENLAVLGQMSRFSQWIFDTIKPFLGKSVLEIGCGNARFSEKMIVLPEVKRYVGVDYQAAYRAGIETLAGLYPQKDISFQAINLDQQPLGVSGEACFDSIICLNVLEHLRDDRAALQDFASALTPGGRLVLQVPAFQLLYGSIDTVVGHHRRYNRRNLIALARSAGLEVERSFYFNLVGIAAWIWHAKIRRLTVHPEGDMKAGDRLVPLFKALESFLPMPVGLSLFLVAKRKANASSRS